MASERVGALTGGYLKFWGLFLGVRFSLFSLVRGPCVGSTRVVRVLPPTLYRSGLDEGKNKSKKLYAGSFHSSEEGGDL